MCHKRCVESFSLNSNHRTKPQGRRTNLVVSTEHISKPLNLQLISHISNPKKTEDVSGNPDLQNSSRPCNLLRAPTSCGSWRGHEGDPFEVGETYGVSSQSLEQQKERRFFLLTTSGKWRECLVICLFCLKLFDCLSIILLWYRYWCIYRSSCCLWWLSGRCGLVVQGLVVPLEEEEFPKTTSGKIQRNHLKMLGTKCKWVDYGRLEDFICWYGNYIDSLMLLWLVHQCWLVYLQDRLGMARPSCCQALQTGGSLSWTLRKALQAGEFDTRMQKLWGKGVAARGVWDARWDSRARNSIENPWESSQANSEVFEYQS